MSASCDVLQRISAQNRGVSDLLGRYAFSFPDSVIRGERCSRTTLMYSVFRRMITFPTQRSDLILLLFAETRAKFSSPAREDNGNPQKDTDCGAVHGLRRDDRRGDGHRMFSPMKRDQLLASPEGFR